MRLSLIQVTMEMMMLGENVTWPKYTLCKGRDFFGSAINQACAHPVIGERKKGQCILRGPC